MQLGQITRQNFAVAIDAKKFSLKAKERTEYVRIQEFDQGVNILELAFQRCSGEYEGVGTAQLFDGLGGACRPIFDTLRFIQDDNIWREDVVNVVNVSANLLVMGDHVDVGFAVGSLTCGFGAIHLDHGLTGKGVDLAGPFGF